jgi:hypothetical protein
MAKEPDMKSAKKSALASATAARMQQLFSGSDLQVWCVCVCEYLHVCSRLFSCLGLHVCVCVCVCVRKHLLAAAAVSGLEFAGVCVCVRVRVH